MEVKGSRLSLCVVDVDEGEGKVMDEGVEEKMGEGGGFLKDGGVVVKVTGVEEGVKW